MLYDCIKQLRNEVETASNIKSDYTRNSVQDSLRRVIEHLKSFHNIPKNGLAIFSGIGEIHSIQPPKEIQLKLYRCDDHFHTSWLKDMVKNTKCIGLISIDSHEAGIGILLDNNVKFIKTETSGVSGKHSKGGQSQRRYERLRNNEINDFFHRVADLVNKIMIAENISELIIAGPIPTKDNFIKTGYMDYRLKTIMIIDGGYSGESGLRELVNNISNDGKLLEHTFLNHKRLIDRFMMGVVNDNAIYGIDDIKTKLSHIETIILNDDIDHDIFCNIDELSIKNGIDMEVISSKSEHGIQLNSFGGIGALLKH